jgi:preprotein translocase subunit SecY
LFKTIKNALKTPDVRKKLLYTLLLIVIFRFGCYITVPGVNYVTLDAMKSQIAAERFF